KRHSAAQMTITVLHGREPGTMLSLYYDRFFFSDPPTPEIYTLSLHDALPISEPSPVRAPRPAGGRVPSPSARAPRPPAPARGVRDRKSTRLNSSHVAISYAVFCLKKKINQSRRRRAHPHHPQLRGHPYGTRAE